MAVPAVHHAKSDADVVLAPHTIQAPDPGVRGPYPVRTLAYGSGTDRRRAVYRDSVAVKTATVDASPFVTLEPTDTRVPSLPACVGTLRAGAEPC